MKKKMLVAALMLIVMMTQISAFASSYATYAVHNEKAVLKAADNLGEYAVIPKELEGVTVEGIGADAFKNNKELKGIEIPETVSYIEWGAFEGCDNLTDINIPQNVMKIEDMTFADCTSLENIKLPEKLQEIGNGDSPCPLHSRILAQTDSNTWKSTLLISRESSKMGMNASGETIWPSSPR